MMLVSYGLGKDDQQSVYTVSYGYGAFQLSLTIIDLLCVIQNVQILEYEQTIDACEQGLVKI